MKTKLKYVVSSPHTDFKIINKYLNNFIMSTFNYKSLDLEVQNGTLVWVNPALNGNLVMPEGTVDLDIMAFMEGPEVGSVSIPSTFTDFSQLGDFIRTYAVPEMFINTEIVPGGYFDDNNLHAVVFGPNVRNIEEDAFNGCTNLKGIQLMSSYVSIGRGAFLNCPKMYGVIFSGRLIFWKGVFDKNYKFFEPEYKYGMPSMPLQAQCWSKKWDIKRGIDFYQLL